MDKYDMPEIAAAFGQEYIDNKRKAEADNQEAGEEEIENTESKESNDGSDDEPHGDDINEDDTEDVGEDGQNDEEDETEDEEDDDDIETEKSDSKKKITSIPKQQYDRMNKKRKQLEEQLQYELQEKAIYQNKINELEKALHELVSPTGAKDADDSSEDGEYFDPKLAKKLDALEEKFGEYMETATTNSFNKDLESERYAASQANPAYGEAEMFLIANEATMVLDAAQEAGQDIDNDTAVGIAVQRLTNAVKSRHGKGLKMADWVYRQATLKGFTPTQKAKKARKSKVDIEAVDKARKEAGSPKTEHVNTTGGVRDMDVSAMIARKLKAKFAD